MEPMPQESIERKIHTIRGKQVMLDRDLAGLYQVSTKALNQAVRRNAIRFPEDFMFRLSVEEYRILRSQIVTLEKPDLKSAPIEGFPLKQGQYSKYPPYAFTEQGVAMLSSVLNSPVAISVNIQIIRTFVNLRRMITTRQELWLKIDEMEKKYNTQFQVVFKAIKLLLDKSRDKPGKRWES